MPIVYVRRVGPDYAVQQVTGTGLPVPSRGDRLTDTQIGVLIQKGVTVKIHVDDVQEEGRDI